MYRLCVQCALAILLAHLFLTRNPTPSKGWSGIFQKAGKELSFLWRRWSSFCVLCLVSVKPIKSWSNILKRSKAWEDFTIWWILLTLRVEKVIIGLLILFSCEDGEALDNSLSSMSGRLVRNRDFCCWRRLSKLGCKSWTVLYTSAMSVVLFWFYNSVGALLGAVGSSSTWVSVVRSTVYFVIELCEVSFNWIEIL